MVAVWVIEEQGGSVEENETEPQSCTSVNNLVPNPQWSLSKLTGLLKSDMAGRENRNLVKRLSPEKKLTFFLKQNSSQNVQNHLLIITFKSQHLSCHHFCLGMYRSLSMLAALLRALH